MFYLPTGDYKCLSSNSITRAPSRLPSLSLEVPAFSAGSMAFSACQVLLLMVNCNSNNNDGNHYNNDND